MTLTGGEILLAGAGAVLTPAALLLLVLAAVCGLAASREGHLTGEVASGLGLAVTFSLVVLARDPLLARGEVLTRWAVGTVFLLLGVLRWLRPRNVSVLYLAPLLGVLLATLRVPVGGPRLLLLYGAGVDAGVPVGRWVYHLGTGLPLALVFLVAHRLARKVGPAGPRVAGSLWIAVGVCTMVGLVGWLGQVLLREVPILSLG